MRGRSARGAKLRPVSSFEFLELDDLKPAPAAVLCCPACGQPARSWETFCAVCGTRLEAIRQLELNPQPRTVPAAAHPVLCCQHCGTPIRPDEVACHACMAAIHPDAGHAPHPLPPAVQVPGRFCEVCGGFLTDDQTICHQCQTPLTAAAVPHRPLPHLGHPSNQVFCEVCGGCNDPEATTCRDCQGKLTPVVERHVPEEHHTETRPAASRRVSLE